MDYRACCRWAEGTLFTAVAWLQVVIFFWPEDVSQQCFYWLAAAHDAQSLAGISLATAWLVLGPGSMSLRAAGSPLLIAIGTLQWHENRLPNPLSGTFVLTLIFLSLAMSCGIRLMGLKVARRSPGRELSKFQFSLKTLLATTTAVAVVLGLLHAATPLLSYGNIDLAGGGRWPHLSSAQLQLRQFVVGAGAALSAVGGFWVALRPGAMWPRMAIVFALAAALSGYLDIFSGYSPEQLPKPLGLCFSYWAVIAMAGLLALPLRAIGLRLHRPAETRNPALRSMLPQRTDLAVTTILLLNAALLAWFLTPAIQLGVNWGRDRIREPLYQLADWIDNAALSERSSIWTIPDWIESAYLSSTTTSLRTDDDPFAVETSTAGQISRE